MTRARLKLAQEGCLWEIALAYFGPEKLLETIVDLWGGASPPTRPTVEHLSTDTLPADVVNILKIAQVRVGALVPDRVPVPGVVTLYAGTPMTSPMGSWQDCREASSPVPCGDRS